MSTATLQLSNPPAAQPWAGTGDRALSPASDAEAAALDARARAAKPLTGDWGFGTALRHWLKYPSTRLMALCLCVLSGARVAAGPLGWLDLAVVAVLFAWEPLNEWLIHAHLLHLKPRRVGPKWLRFHLDLPMARRHRAHHADPWDLPNLFIPIGAILFSIAFHSVVFFLVLPTDLALTALAALNLVGLWYEWTHFMAHIPYRPSLPWLRTLQARHRLHHFKNERFWLGVSSNLGDRMLNTLPDAKQVEPSPTARLLQR
ncbi:MAG: sterol desaturase family protein [Deltaproteobacteria bacterium]|nr:sterol desaturase family protein [Deltaproteobacteria bacterium]